MHIKAEAPSADDDPLVGGGVRWKDGRMCRLRRLQGGRIGADRLSQSGKSGRGTGRGKTRSGAAANDA